MHEFFFLPFSEIKPKIGYHRLQTQRRGTHRKFFDYLFLIEIKILAVRRIYDA